MNERVFNERKFYKILMKNIAGEFSVMIYIYKMIF